MQVSVGSSGGLLHGQADLVVAALRARASPRPDGNALPGRRARVAGAPNDGRRPDRRRKVASRSEEILKVLDGLVVDLRDVHRPRARASTAPDACPAGRRVRRARTCRSRRPRPSSSLPGSSERKLSISLPTSAGVVSPLRQGYSRATTRTGRPSRITNARPRTVASAAPAMLDAHARVEKAAFDVELSQPVGEQRRVAILAFLELERRFERRGVEMPVALEHELDERPGAHAHARAARPRRRFSTRWLTSAP